MKSKDLAGWLIAAMIGGGIAGSGFQVSTPKYATADIDKIATECNANLADQAQLKAAQTARVDLLTFMSKNPVISGQDAAQLRKLSLMVTPTDADKASLLNLKAKIEADETKYQQLQATGTLTADDKMVLNDFAGRVKTMNTLIPQWDQEFSSELRLQEAQNQASVLAIVNLAAAQVGKMQGCTLVFDSNVAPYCTIDLTVATLQVVNSQK